MNQIFRPQNIDEMADVIRAVFVLFWHICLASKTLASKDIYNDDYFPQIIRKVSVRKDEITNEPVSRGRIELVGGLVGEYSFRKNSKERKGKRRVHIDELKRTLQCAAREPSLDGSRGTAGLLKLLTPTKETVEYLCASIESGCTPIYKCEDAVKTFKAGKYQTGHGYDGNSNRNLIRILNDDLYLDWPWGRQRLKNDPYPSMTILLFQLFDRAYGLPDCVFIMAAEQSFLDWNVPFPAFSNSPSFRSSDIPWPWYESLRTEMQLHRDVVRSQRNFSGMNFHSAFTTQLEWSKRIPKALYLGEMIVSTIN